MNNLVIAAFLVPLATAVLSVPLRKTDFRDVFSLLGSAVYTLAVIFLSFKVFSTGALVFQAGGWPAPYGISFIADELSALMLLMTALVSFAGNLYSASFIEDVGKRNGYYVFFHFMIAGMTGAFLTADLFNLFVMFELLLMSSYALVAYTGSREALFTSLKYVVLNLIGSSLMLVSIGGLYSVTGTLNMADMANVLAAGEVNMVPVLGFSMVLFCVFGIKSGVVPFQFWVPTVYSNSPAPVSAMMAGISKKVGIYAVIRLYFTVFQSARIPSSAVIFAGESVSKVLGWTVLVVALFSILFGGLGALNRDRFEKLLSYSSIGQAGFVYVAIALGLIYSSKIAVIAALAYMINHAFAKSSLFMVSGIVKRNTGTTKLSELGGLSEKSSWLAAVVMVSALSLVGVPPLLGFFSKFMVFQATVESNTVLTALTVFLGALFTIVYSTKIITGMLFGKPVEKTIEVSKLEKIGITALILAVVVFGLGFESFYITVELAAETVLEPDRYIETVLGGSQ